MNRIKSFRSDILPMIGSVFSCLFWFIDSAIDTYIFNTQRLYYENLLRPEMAELISRSQVIVLLMTFSLIAMYLLRQQKIITEELNSYKCDLERIVEERTNDINIKNEILETEIMERLKVEAELVHLATIDPLTSISNRRKFNEVLHYEINREERYHHELSLIICDLDNFKDVNDEYGHNIGDDVLKKFTELVSNNIRKTDVFARWGGEEFVVLLPETDIDTALKLAEELRRLTESYVFPYVGQVTASFGVTLFQENSDENAFIHRADDALYKAKESGRNKVESIPLPQLQQQKITVHDADPMKAAINSK